MKISRIFLILFLSLLALPAKSENAKPQFSNGTTEHWYYLTYNNTGKVIQDNGDGEALTAAAPEENKSSQKWKLVGDENNFTLISAAGGYVYKSGAFRTATDSSKGNSFKLLASNVADSWMVKYPADDWGCMNQYGNGTIDGYWDDANDANNAICFKTSVSESDVPEGLPLFSNDTEEHWYYVYYENVSRVFTENGEGQALTHKSIAFGSNAQKWKLVGDYQNFHLVSSDGRAVYKDGPFRASSDMGKAHSLQLLPSPNPEFKGCWVINYPGDGWGCMNPYGDGEINGYWNDPTDSNNNVTFIPYDQVKKPLDMSGIAEFTVNGATAFAPENRSTLWYTSPVTIAKVDNPWMEYALPIGNGEFGGMVYGGIHCEQLQFNDKSVWTGTSNRRGSYQNFGDLFIEDISGVFESAPVENYVRYLDMRNAIAGVRYSGAGVSYTREYLSSFPDKVIAVRLAADRNGKISVRLRLRNNVRSGFVTPVYADGVGSFEGKLDLVDFKAAFKAVPTGGTMVTNSDNIEIKDADEVLIILAGATNFDQHSPSYISDAAAMRTMMDTRIDNACSQSWDVLKAAHCLDFNSYFDRVDLSLGKASNNMTTESLVDSYAAGNAPEMERLLEKLYFDYGRYLLISSSRGMDSPANLQGIWNNSDNPAWQSDIHSNINVQMNYWLAENTNLSELHMPYLNYVHSMAMEHEQWPSYAQKSGQTEGWTCFTQNNIFGHSDYAENYVIANAWYTSHLWQHYRYTLDEEFLRDKALPVMVSCCKFWMERLKTASDGTLVAPDEWSPEHGPDREDGTAHAQQIIAELFESTLAALDIAGDAYPADFRTSLAEKYDKLDKGLAVETYTGSWGSSLNGIASGTEILREWKYSDYSRGQNGHRHQSHLMDMYPFGTITPESPYFLPAVNSLTLRGDKSTGWSLAWRVNLWARALDGNHALKVMRNALKHSTSYAIEENKGGIYYNLLDSHAPFQIDGNFGFSAGVAEMLLQSYGGNIRLLPALPDAWNEGHANGLRAEGNFEVDQQWQKGALTEAVLKSGSGKDVSVCYRGIADAEVTDGTGNKVTFTADGKDKITFATVKDGEYRIVLTTSSGVCSVEASQVEGPWEYYDLSGRRVAEANLSTGIYIRRCGSVAEKIIVH